MTDELVDGAVEGESFSFGFLVFSVACFAFGLITLGAILGGLWTTLSKIGVASFPAALSFLSLVFGWGMIGLNIKSVDRLWGKCLLYVSVAIAFFGFAAYIGVNSGLPISPYVVFGALFLCGQNFYWALTVRRDALHEQH